jgi:hypothetical protein
VESAREGRGSKWAPAMWPGLILLRDRRTFIDGCSGKGSEGRRRGNLERRSSNTKDSIIIIAIMILVRFPDDLQSQREGGAGTKRRQRPREC